MTTTGTLAVAEAQDVAAVSGSIFIACVVATSEAQDVVAIIGAVPAIAALLLTEQVDDFVGVIFLTLIGTMSASELPDAVAVSLYDFMFKNHAPVSSSVGTLPTVASAVAATGSAQSMVS